MTDNRCEAFHKDGWHNGTNSRTLDLTIQRWYIWLSVRNCCVTSGVSKESLQGVRTPIGNHNFFRAEVVAITTLMN